MNRLAPRIAVAAALALLLPGCGREIPPAMTLATSATPVDPGAATVVFVRPLSPCDTSDYSIVADEAGHFVGNVAPGTQLAVPVSPGPHVYYAWSNRDLRVAREPNFNPVGAARVNARASEARYVALVVRTREASTSRCWRWAIVDLRSVPRDGPFADEVLSWTRSTKLLTADQASGQATLDADPLLLQSNLELGSRKMTSARPRRRTATPSEPRAHPDDGISEITGTSKFIA
jgi:hypothetical protein